METTSAQPGQTFVENWIVIHHYRILKYFYFNISYKGKIDSLTPLGASEKPHPPLKPWRHIWMSPKKFKIRKNSPFLDFLRLQVHPTTYSSELILPRHLPAAKLLKILKKRKMAKSKSSQRQKEKINFQLTWWFLLSPPVIPPVSGSSCL
jgi:hypothetical protein